MPRVSRFEGIVLRTYDVGDADRFCILLTREGGRMTACAKGARKPGSRLCGAMQSFQHLSLDLAEHSSGLYVRSVQPIESFSALRGDPDRFVLASRGCDLLLQFVHDSDADDGAFSLFRDYLEHVNCNGSKTAFSVFQIMLMQLLGLVPSFESHHATASLRLFSKSIPLSLRTFLSGNGGFHERVAYPFSPSDRLLLEELLDALLRENLHYPLRSSAVAAEL